MAVKHMLPAVPDAAEKLVNDYSVAHQALEQFIFQTHNKWFNTIDSSIKNHLQNNLLTQDRADREHNAEQCGRAAACHHNTLRLQHVACVLLHSDSPLHLGRHGLGFLCAQHQQYHWRSTLLSIVRAGNLLSMNYDRQLLSMSQEVQHWERLRMQVPYIAMEIQAQREKYRVLRDNMLMLVHDYNKVNIIAGCDQHTASSPDSRTALDDWQLCCCTSFVYFALYCSFLPLCVFGSQVLTALDSEERRLFADRIRALDRRIMPGVSKLNWVSDKHALEFYCKEARNTATSRTTASLASRRGCPVSMRCARASLRIY